MRILSLATAIVVVGIAAPALSQHAGIELPVTLTSDAQALAEYCIGRLERQYDEEGNLVSETCYGHYIKV